MIKFDNPIIEDLCEKILTKEENELKIVNPHTILSIMLCSDKEQNKILEETIKGYEDLLKRARLALTLNQMITELDAHVVEIT
jgi:lactam utilization protein B